MRYDRPEERFAYLEREGAHLMLEQSTDRTFLGAELTQPYGRGMNLQIKVTGVDALYSRVVANDSVVHLAIEEKWYRRDETMLGNRQFVIQDPDGYLLRFFEDIGSRTYERASSTSLAEGVSQ